MTGKFDLLPPRWNNIYSPTLFPTWKRGGVGGWGVGLQRSESVGCDVKGNIRASGPRVATRQVVFGRFRI